MNIELKISSQYLRSKRKKGFVSFISGVSGVGLILGVMALITVLSVMNGFHKELKDRVLSAISHATISEFGGAMKNWQSALKIIKNHPKIISASPYIEDYALLTNEQKSQGVSVRGIIPELSENDSLLNKIKFGNSDLEGATILIGIGLAAQLNVALGDKITLLTPILSSSIIGANPRFKRFTISGIFDAGVNEYDNNLAFIHLEQAQKLYLLDDKITGIRIKVDDLFQARTITEQVASSLGDRYYGVDWTAKKSNFIQALNLEKQMIAIILSLIIAVAAFNIVSMMVMVVIDKKADIAILKTLGMTPKRINKIFFYQALSIGVVGILLGTILGVLLALNIGSVVGGIEAILGFQFFPEDVFYINRFPSEIYLSDVLQVAFGAFILVIIAAIYPAKRAGKVNIARVLSYE